MDQCEGKPGVEFASRSSQDLLQEMYNDSICSKIALDERFQNLTLAVIVINAGWIGIDIEKNHANIPVDGDELPLYPGYKIVENLFCLYFTFEVVVRFGSYRRKISCLFDGWFVFDSVLVFFMVLETWIFGIVELISSSGGGGFLSNFSALRLLRLLRLTRMARLMNAVPELMMLVKGMISSAKAVSWIIIFLILVMYVFAIILCSAIAEPPGCTDPDKCANMVLATEEGVLEDEPCVPGALCKHAYEMGFDEGSEHEAFDGEVNPKYIFGTLGDAMMTLFTNGVLGDNLYQTVQSLHSQNPTSVPLVEYIFWIFFVISSCTLLNMLIGVLCDVITKNAEAEKLAASEAAMRLTLSDAFAAMDANEDGRVTAQEWDQMKKDPKVRKALTCNGIDGANLDEQLEKMHQAIFAKKNKKGKEGLALDEFVNRLLDIQPTKPTSSLELSLLRSRIEMKEDKLHEYMLELEGAMNILLAANGMEPIPVLQASPSKASGSLNRESSNLAGVSSSTLLGVLKSRTSPDPPRSTASTPMVMQSAFPTPEPDLAEANELDIGITEEDRAEARQHPLFQQLASRNPPGGWGKALLIAKLCTIKKPVTLQEICQQAKDTSVSELQALIEALPELFEYLPVSGTVTAITPVPPVEPARGRQAANSSAGQDDRGQSVWRLCDALAQGSSARSLQ